MSESLTLSAPTADSDYITYMDKAESLPQASPQPKPEPPPLGDLISNLQTGTAERIRQFIEA